MQLEHLGARWLPAGDFTNINALLAGTGRNSVVWGDYNSDGHLDLVTCGFDGSVQEYFTRVYKGDGSGGLTLDTNAILTGVFPGNLAWGDYNNDGHLDLALQGATPSGENVKRITQVYEGDGLGGFTLDTKAILTGTNAGTVTWGDFNGDGHLDLITSGSTDQSNGDEPVLETLLYMGDGTGGFTLDTDAVLPGVRNVGSPSVACGDYSSDGHLDLVISGSTTSTSTTPLTRVYTGNGAGGFTLDAGANLSSVGDGSVAWGDFNSDGHLDLVISGVDSNQARITRVYTGDGKGAFAPNTNANLPGVSGAGVAWGDFNNDGHLDLVISGFAGSSPDLTALTQIFTGDGAGGFTLDANANVTQLGNGSVAWGDYDNDSRLDLIISGVNAPTQSTEVYDNTSASPANAAPTAPASLSTTFPSSTSATFSWNAATEIRQPRLGCRTLCEWAPHPAEPILSIRCPIP